MEILFFREPVDHEAGAAYLRFKRGEVARTIHY